MMHAPQGAAPRRRPLGGVRSEEGFTLLELLVIVSTIAILIGIGLPSFLSARQKAQDHAAQANLRTALEAANAAYVDTQDFSQVDTTALAAEETGVHFVTSRVSSVNTVHVLVGVGYSATTSNVGFVAMATPAGDGTCWYVFQTNDGAPGFGKGGAAGDGSCDANDALGLTNPDFPI